MAAQTITTAVTLFAAPSTLNCGTSYSNESLAFQYAIDGKIRTLSDNNAPAEDSYRGLLFVPTLEAMDTCNNITAPYIPQNVTRRIDLPEYDHDIIGLAPWVNRDCTQAYLAASRRENARAVIFYQPNSRDTSKPPSSNSGVWNLGDSDYWKKDNDFPVYAIPGPSGSRLMHQLSEYSRQSTDNSSLESSPETAYSVRCARLYTLFNFEADALSSVPGIWVFILAILGALVFVMLLAYVITQHVQKKRRVNLQQRLVAGEIDLEHLGIKRLVVPPHLLSQLPVYVYPDNTAESPIDPDSKTPASEEKESPQEPNSKSEENEELKTQAPQQLHKNDNHHQQQVQQQQQENYDESISAILEEVTPPPRIRNRYRLTFSQLTCAICLDDFVPGSSLVRELPCTHIFHPECVDAFLMRDGSTCPVCKHNVLPSSFISEQVTNFMVRREQRMRRLHSHHDREMELQGLYLSFFERVQARVRGLVDRARGRSSPSSSSSDEQQQQQQQQQSDNSEEDHDPVRREMMQMRAMAILGAPVNNSSPQQQTHLTTESSLSSFSSSAPSSSSSSSSSSLSSSSFAQSSPNLP